jgi:hypothetical protein
MSKSIADEDYKHEGIGKNAKIKRFPMSHLFPKKKQVAGKMNRADKVGTRKKDISGGKQGNWMKVMKGDR